MRAIDGFDSYIIYNANGAAPRPNPSDRVNVSDCEPVNALARVFKARNAADFVAYFETHWCRSQGHACDIKHSFAK